jgi:excisionase family DNA binding protein
MGTIFPLTRDKKPYKLDYRHFMSFHIISGGERMDLLTAKEAAKYLRISLFTLARIEKQGMLVPFRTPGGHRRYSLEMLDEYLERSRSRSAAREKRILVVDEGDEMLDLLTHAFSSHRFCREDDTLGVGMQLAEFKPHLVLVNTKISGLDGADLCERLSAQGVELEVLPFEAPREGEEGAKATELNPVNLDGLMEMIERVLGE